MRLPNLLATARGRLTLAAWNHQRPGRVIERHVQSPPIFCMRAFMFASPWPCLPLCATLKPRPLSVTVTVIMLVLGPWASAGVQVSTPVLVLRFTPGGAAMRLKERVLAGISGSVARLVAVRVVSSSNVCVGGTVRVGARLT